MQVIYIISFAAGLLFYVAALVCTVAGTAFIVATRCKMCPRGVFRYRNNVFRSCHAGGNRGGKRGKKLVFCVAGRAGCISKNAVRLNTTVVKL